MKKLTQNSIQGMPFKNLTQKTTLFFLTAVLCISGCAKNGLDQQNNPAVSNKTTATVSGAQPLPAGKQYYSTVSGNLDSSGDTWVQLINYTFTAATGTVAATRWDWGSTSKRAAVVINGPHNCTQDGILDACNTYTLDGWMGAGNAIANSMAGTYTMAAGGVGTLSISWTSGELAGRTETWTVSSAPFGYALGKMLFASNVSGWPATNGMTHGIGYGSNQPFSTHKTISQIPNVSCIETHGQRVMASKTDIAVNPTGTDWDQEAFNFGTSFGWTTATGGTTWHAKMGSTICTSGCAAGNTHKGHIYHLAGIGTGTSRYMAYSHFCACLPTPEEFPKYGRNLHPYAFIQIIDDAGAMKGFIGVEAQNPSDAQYGGAYQFQLKSYLH